MLESICFRGWVRALMKKQGGCKPCETEETIKPNWLTSVCFLCYHCYPGEKQDWPVERINKEQKMSAIYTLVSEICNPDLTS